MTPPGIATLFRSADGRPRAFWRLVLYDLAFFVSALLVASPVLLGMRLLVAQLPAAQAIQGLTPNLDLGALTAAAVATAVATLVVLRAVDRRNLASIGLTIDQTTLRRTGLGVALGGGLMTAVAGILALTGGIAITGPRLAVATAIGPIGIAAVLAFGALSQLLVAWTEEVFARGYLLQTLRTSLGTGRAVALTALLFGLLHLANPGATFVGAAIIAAMGVLLALTVLTTRSLWMAIGLHWAWNFAQGFVFGLPISGGVVPGVFQTVDLGPTIWTGGPFGPEGGIVGLAAALIGIAVIRWQGRRAGTRPHVAAATPA